LERIMEFTPIILIHVLAATGALLTGGLALLVKKGSTAHRLFGRLWVVLIVLAALVSFGIRRSSHFSAIHLLSILMLVAVTAAIYAAATGRIQWHRRAMRGAYVSLAVAAVFTLLPGRRMGDLVWNAIGLI
jgi:uncharacterized membrane protein